MRMRWYLALMGVCLTLIVLAWTIVRQFSTDLALVMSAVAAVLPTGRGDRGQLARGPLTPDDHSPPSVAFRT